MAERKSEAIWIESRSRWQINVQDNGVRKTFTSTLAGRRGKADADSEGIDAGGNGQRQHCFGGVVIVQLFVAAEAFPHHVDADDGQQHKGYPGTEVGQDHGEAVTQEEAQCGHQELEAAEPQPAGHGVGKADLVDRKALADRNGKSVHGKADGDQDQVK